VGPLLTTMIRLLMPALGQKPTFSPILAECPFSRVKRTLIWAQFGNFFVSAFGPCDLLLKATRGVTIVVVSSRERKRRQPGLATDDPAFVGWHKLVRGIQGSQVHFDFVCAACENRRAAAGTKKPPGVVACFAIDRHCILRKHRRSVKKGPMMLATIEAVTKADPVWESRRHKSDLAAQATAGELVHAVSPLKSSGVRVRTILHPILIAMTI
jgi:hypothetical protein